MRLSRAERERVLDSRLKIQAAAEALEKVDQGKIPGFAAIEDCLEDAAQHLGVALRSTKE